MSESVGFQTGDSAHWMMCSDIDDYLDAWPIDQRLQRIEWLEARCADLANARMIQMTGGVR